MKQRQLARLAAFLAGVTGGAAFGHDHLPPVECSQYPSWCRPYCYELNACRAGNTPIGGSDCWTEENNLAFCELRGPPRERPVVIVPPPQCPQGQHFNVNVGQCQADHECGDDELGGGSEECKRCGAGKVPNEDGTACLTCEHGESGTPGICAEPDYVVARCSRPLASLPERVARLLPFHVNVFVKEQRRFPPPLERGFFAVDILDAADKAGIFLTSGVVVFSEGQVVKDADLGDCVYESDVDSVRYSRVRSRMVNYRWTNYHLIVKEHGHRGYGTCITWADSVLAAGSHY